jgi:hypothetical protein
MLDVAREQAYVLKLVECPWRSSSVVFRQLIMRRMRIRNWISEFGSELLDPLPQQRRNSLCRYHPAAAHVVSAHVVRPTYLVVLGTLGV